MSSSGGLGIMRQFVGGIRDETHGHGTCCCRIAPLRVREAAAPAGRGRAGDDGARRRARPDAVRRRAGRLGRRRRLRRRGALGRLHGGRAGHRRTSGAGGGRWARCPAASRSGWCWRRCCAARTRSCCWTSRTTTWTCRASAGWSSSSRPRRKTVLLVSHDRELLANCAERIVTVEDGNVWVHGGGFATYAPGPAGPHRAARRAAPPLGRGAREDQAAGPDVPAEGVLQRRAWPPGCRPPRPGCASSRRPGRRSWRRGSRTCGCGCAAAGPASAR